MPSTFVKTRYDQRWLGIALKGIELALIVGFSIWLTWPYLGGTPRTDRPAGLDFVVSIQGRYFWDHVRECGSCALWNGDVAGGTPALLDTSTDMLHPLVAIPVLLLGVLEGSRVAVTLVIILSGLSSWWLAYLLRTGWLARLFAGGLGVAGGHITGRLDYGLVVLMTSIATASLLVPAAILFSRHLDRRSTATLGVLLGVTAISGQAYIQVGVLLLSPAVLLLVAHRSSTWKLILLRLIQAGALGTMLAATLLLPVVRYHRILDKDQDPYFSRSQPFKFVPLNLIIDNRSYFSSSIFKQAGFPAWHSNYIGWIAILFALLGVGRLWNQSRREALFLGVLAVGALWLGSGELFKWIAGQSSLGELQSTAVKLRTTSNIANLAVPPIIGLAACGVDRVYTYLDRSPKVRLHISTRADRTKRPVLFGFGFLVAIPVILCLHDVARSARQWNGFNSIDSTPIPHLAESLQSPELRWVNGNSMTVDLAFYGLQNGLKLGNQWQPWRIDPSRNPGPGVWASIEGPIPGTHRVEGPPGMDLYVPNDGNPYARVRLPTGQDTNCSATGRGAHIDIACPAVAAGPLTVQERYVDGWSAVVNGQPVDLVDRDGWLGLELPEGSSSIELRFHSPFFRSSLMLTALGILWAIWWIIFPKRYMLAPPRSRHTGR